MNHVEIRGSTFHAAFETSWHLAVQVMGPSLEIRPKLLVLPGAQFSAKVHDEKHDDQ